MLTQAKFALFSSDALIRAGRRTQAETEAVVLRAMLVQYEGPDGELAGMLRERTAAAAGKRATPARDPGCAPVVLASPGRW